MTVEILIKANGPVGLEGVVSQEDSADFLKEMNLTVTDPDSKLFDAPADQTAGLTNWVSLGKFKSGADIDLNVALNVPITMGNDYQERIGALDWTFKVIEYPVPTEAKTGDNMNILLIGGICAAALALIGVIIAGKRNKRNKA